MLGILDCKLALTNYSDEVQCGRRSRCRRSDVVPLSRRVLVLLLFLRLAAAYVAAPLRLLRQSAFHPAAVARLSTVVAGVESDGFEARSSRRDRERPARRVVLARSFVCLSRHASKAFSTSWRPPAGLSR